jgi:hypothetical protein
LSKARIKGQGQTTCPSIRRSDKLNGYSGRTEG